MAATQGSLPETRPTGTDPLFATCFADVAVSISGVSRSRHARAERRTRDTYRSGRPGRIVSQSQLIGFSADLAYSVIRTEVFLYYLFGREPSLKDRVVAGRGVLLVEEAPLAGKTVLQRGFEGAFDAYLKLFGI